jgi:hypothetical protein
MTISSDTNLETPDYGAPGWNHVYNSNMDRLNGELLKLKALVDVDADELNDGEPIIYNSSTQKWEALYP